MLRKWRVHMGRKMSTGDDVGYLSTGSGAVLIGRNSRKLTNLTEDITSANHHIRPMKMYTSLLYYIKSRFRSISAYLHRRMLPP